MRLYLVINYFLVNYARENSVCVCVCVCAKIVPINICTALFNTKKGADCQTALKPVKFIACTVLSFIFYTLCLFG